MMEHEISYLNMILIWEKKHFTIFYGCTTHFHKYRVLPCNATYTHTCKEVYLSCPRVLEHAVLAYVYALVNIVSVISAAI